MSESFADGALMLQEMKSVSIIEPRSALVDSS
jgi:hypothetical protein